MWEVGQVCPKHNLLICDDAEGGRPLRRGISAEYVRFKTGRNRSDCRTGCVSLAPSLEAAVIASALIELSQYTKGRFSKECLSVAETQLKTLSSPEYLAEPGTNCNFILKHSVGNKPKKKEVDVPLTYADYYYVEALLRYKKSILKDKISVETKK